jgi:hypothetical protein
MHKDERLKAARRDSCALRDMVAVIIVTALAFRIVSMMIFHTWAFEGQWMFGWEMGRIGQLLDEGLGFNLDGVSPTRKLPPTYAYLMAGVYIWRILELVGNSLVPVSVGVRSSDRGSFGGSRE